MHITPIMSLHYIVKHKYLKTNNIYTWIVSLMIYILRHLTQMLDITYSKSQKGLNIATK